MEFTIDNGKNIFIRISEKESAAVQIAADNLEKDIGKAFRHIRVFRDTGEEKIWQNPGNGRSFTFPGRKRETYYKESGQLQG